MKIGLTLPSMVAGLTRDVVLDWCRRIDAGPFSSLACGERITSPNQEIMVTMAAAAAITERVRLALTLIILPMHSPVLIAKQAATLDVLSGGRVTLGVGIGGRGEDYRSVGAPFEGRIKRLRAGGATMRRGWGRRPPVPRAPPRRPPPRQPGRPAI